MQRLIAVLRRPQAIFALVSERRHAFAVPGGDHPDPYTDHILPLAATHESVCPWKDKDVRAWRALGRVPRLNERAGLAIVRSIIGSVVDEQHADAPVSQLRLSEAQPADLRPHLCCPTGEQELLEGLSSVLTQVTDGLDFPDWHWNQRADIAALPPAFRRSFLWGLHLSPWKQVQMTLAAYQELDLATDEPLRRAVARMLSFADREIGILWCAVLCEVPRETRVHATEVVLETGAYRARPTDQLLRLLVAGDYMSICRALQRAA